MMKSNVIVAVTIFLLAFTAALAVADTLGF